MTPILLLAAVEHELAPALACFAEKRPLTVAGRTGYALHLGTRPIIAIVAGPGAVNTAQSLTAAIERFAPDLIVQVGCAGGFAQAGVSVGDVAMATEEIDAHMGIEPTDSTEGDGVRLAPLPFPLLEREEQQYRNRFPLDQNLADEALAAARHLRPTGFSCHKGPFVSGSTITATASRASALFALWSPLMESMEGAAAAHTALHYGIPLVEIRGASNLVGPRDRNTWNLPLAFENSCACLMAFLRRKCVPPAARV